MRFGGRVVQGQGTFRGLLGFRHGDTGGQKAVSVGAGQDPGVCKSAPRRCIVRIQVGGLAEEVNALLHGFGAALVPVVAALNIELVGLAVRVLGVASWRFSSLLRRRVNALASRCEMVSSISKSLEFCSSKFSDHSILPSLTRCRCTATCVRSPMRFTVPSRTAWTFSCFPTATGSDLANVLTAPIGRTTICDNLPRRVIKASVSPIPRYWSSALAPADWKGRTAMV